jgi:hypothetical protein
VSPSGQVFSDRAARVSDGHRLTGNSSDPTGLSRRRLHLVIYLCLSVHRHFQFSLDSGPVAHYSNRRGRSIKKDHKPKPAATSATALTASFPCQNCEVQRAITISASLASRSAFKRAVFSRVARASASYSVTAVRPSCARCSFLKRLSARCRA